MPEIYSQHGGETWRPKPTLKESNIERPQTTVETTSKLSAADIDAGILQAEQKGSGILPLIKPGDSDYNFQRNRATESVLMYLTKNASQISPEGARAALQKIEEYIPFLNPPNKDNLSTVRQLLEKQIPKPVSNLEKAMAGTKPVEKKDKKSPQEQANEIIDKFDAKQGKISFDEAANLLIEAIAFKNSDDFIKIAKNQDLQDTITDEIIPQLEQITAS